ncbi:CRISPR-associated endonuclease Cas2 [Sulfurovum sp.]|jgi:CRISPR-associated protein Cas2|uniref:CRISPR-associated endonuclease Cas2 n=1 Tax=Sulfurovum sp. TaxID=1969726 RepID=UPI002A369950|nr:CRISPR-associated endonuclease Cas2 [Sulfurovum sp.]MDY0403683.1 CRISPR-associated endonuclease Cas2 [Sulfurovum sp.]
MMRAVIVYDVVEDKRRRLLSDLLEGFGTRVNRSVFECTLSSKSRSMKLKKGIEKIIDPKVDSVRLYTLCLSCIEKSEGLCDEPHPFEKDAVYFF